VYNIPARLKREYHKWFSKDLGRDMEMLVFGHGGKPVVVFPTSRGRFFEYEDRGMIGAVADRIDAGWLQFFCIDSVDGESWYNRAAEPYWRVQRHMQYERCVVHDVVPLIRKVNRAPDLTTTGCSFGGYHAMNFALRHPDVVTDCVTMGAAYDIKQFLDGWYSEDAYFNNPPDYLPNISDPWYLERYRRMKIIMVTGEHDFCWCENERLAGIMRARGIPHQLYVWGDGTGHDWPWWQRMVREYVR
jgi:esterase/lipase superfamily enzyme